MRRLPLTMLVAVILLPGCDAPVTGGAASVASVIDTAGGIERIADRGRLYLVTADSLEVESVRVYDIDRG